MPSFPQRGLSHNAPVLQLPSDAPQWLVDVMNRAHFTEQFVRWFSLIKPYADSVEGEQAPPSISTSTGIEEALLHGAIMAPPERQPDSGAVLDSTLLNSRRINEPHDLEVVILNAVVPKVVEAVMAELAVLLPPTQRNWVDYVMRQAGGIIKLEGEDAAFPGIARGTTATNTRSRLADDSADTGHEVLSKAYDATTWNGDVTAPNRDDVRDKLEQLAPGITDALISDTAYGAGWDGDVGHGPSKNAVYDKIESLNLASDVYTPTLTDVANLDGSTAFECQYLRVINTVLVSGRVNADVTAATTSTRLGISLPIASNIGATEDVGGVGAANGIAGQSAAILGDAANNRAEMEWVSGDVGNNSMYFTFTYQVIP